MPVFMAALVAARRRRRSSIIVVPMRTPPLWRMVVEEIAVAARGALASVFHQSRSNWTRMRRGGVAFGHRPRALHR